MESFAEFVVTALLFVLFIGLFIAALPYLIAVLVGAGILFFLLCGFGYSRACVELESYFGGALSVIGPILGVVALVILAVLVFRMGSRFFAFIRRAVPWLHFVFVPHPSDRHVAKSPSLDTAREMIDVKELRDDIDRAAPEELRVEWVSENMAKKAEKAGERLDKEAELLDKAIERERKRAEYEERRRGR